MTAPTAQNMDVNRQNPQNEKTGLRAFYIGLLLGGVALFFLMMVSLAAFDGGKDAINRHMKDLLAPIAAHKSSSATTGDLTMVMVGNSRLRHAVTFGFDPEKPVILPDGRKLWAVQFAQNVALFDYYQPVWADIIRTKPDILLVQTALLTTQRRRHDTVLFGASSTILQGLSMFRAKNTPLDNWERERHFIIDTMCIKPGHFDRAAMQDRIIFVANRDNHALDGNDETTALRKALKQAVDTGIRVIMADFPSNAEEAAKFNVPLYDITNYGLDFIPSPAQLLPELHNDVEWLVPPKMHSADFCDYAHLNEQGRKAFTSWFLTEIGKLAPQPSPQP